jgi:YegS/Rv2252/BmrU family lipid kinase
VAKRGWLIFNPAAGLGRIDDLDTMIACLREHFDLRVLSTTRERDGDACAREALAEGADTIIVAGGDGTVSSVASQLIDTDVPLAVIPHGTCSSIARALAIPAGVEAACENAGRGVIRRIDTALANGKEMILNAAIGLHADVVTDTTREAKNRFGVFAYVATGLDALRALELFALTIETEAAVLRCRATALTVANLAPPQTVLAQGPSFISPDDGLLDATVVSSESLLDAVGAGLHLWRTALGGDPATREGIGYLPARKLKIEADPPQRLVIDGEPAGNTPVTIECKPKSLSVIVPELQERREGAEVKLDGLPDLEIRLKK